MLSSELQIPNLVQSLTSYWRDFFPGSCPTIYPGMQRDATGWQAWVEWNLPFFQEEISRDAGFQRLSFTLDVHCFVEQGKDLNKIRELVDQVRQTLSRKVVMIRDFNLSVLPVTGYARFEEVEVRDLSRLERLEAGSRIAHFLLSFRGLAQTTEL